jgi:queuine tRNA-ribosyltransferase
VSALDHEVVLTRSGAPAMRDRRSGEVMHPLVGPLIEAERLYLTPSCLAARLQQPAEQPLVLLDVGLGAGSNAVAAWRLAATPQGRRRPLHPLHIVSFDRSVAAMELALDPAHAAAFGLDGEVGDVARVLLAEGRVARVHATWELRLGELPGTLAAAPAACADVVFWDPFSPAANPELWNLQAFTALRRLCAEGATVHTYSGATAIRSALLLAGFAVGVGETISPGRVATTASTRAANLLRPLDRRWLQRLARSSAALPPDAPTDALERISALPQFAAE